MKDKIKKTPLIFRCSWREADFPKSTYKNVRDHNSSLRLEYSYSLLHSNGFNGIAHAAFSFHIHLKVPVKSFSSVGFLFVFFSLEGTGAFESSGRHKSNCFPCKMYFLLWDHVILKGEKKEAKVFLLSNTHLSSHSQNIFSSKAAALKLLFNQPLLTARCRKC